MLWIKFFICVLLVFISGWKLSSYADLITQKTRLSAGLMGVLFLAVITSCPEIFTSLGSITIVNAPDIAMGDLVGAVFINVFYIALLGVLCKRGSTLAGQSKVNILTAALTALMLFVIIGSIALAHFGNLSPDLLGVGIGSILLGLIYIVGMTIIYRRETKTVNAEAKKGIPKSLILKFITAAVVIIASGLWLARIGKGIADFYHWNEMYVGVLLIALATTMPEFVVSLTALRRNSVYMSVGNLLGSNFFNLFIITLLDILLRKGNLFVYVSKLNIFVALLAMILTAIAIVAMLKKSAKRLFRYFSWDSIAIIAAFAIGHYFLFQLVSR